MPNTSVSLPAEPAKSKHTFLGWFMKKVGKGIQFTNYLKITDDMGVYAHWKYNSTVPNKKGSSVRIRVANPNAFIGTADAYGDISSHWCKNCQWI